MGVSRATAAPAPPPGQAQPLRAAFWMGGAIVSFSAMTIAGRSLSAELDTFEIMMFRSAIGMLVVLAVGGAFGTLRQVSRSRLGLHLTRNLSHFAGQNLWFYAITALPLAQVIAIEFSSPVWVALAAPFFLQERLTRMRLFVALLGFVGVLIVARPEVTRLDPGIAAAALAAVGFAGSAVFTKMLTRDQSVTCIMFWLTGMQLVFGVICAGFDGDITVPSTQLLPWVLLVGLSGLVAHFCLTTALSLAPATIVFPFDFMRLPVIAGIGMLVYGEALDIWVLVGALIIFGANYLNVWTEARKTT